MLLKVLAIGARSLAVDLGTANTVVYAPGCGVVVDEPSIVAVNEETGRTEAVGREAHAMIGRTPCGVRTIRPLREGVIADGEAAERMLGCFLRRAQGTRPWRRTRVVLGVPSGTTQVERRAAVDAARRARASEVHLVDEAMAAAIGAGLPVTEASGSMVVDIGAGTTTIAVVSLGGLVYDRSVRVAGQQLDEAIARFMRRRHALLVGERTAEAVKVAIGSAWALAAPARTEVRGRCLREGRPRAATVTDAEIREALAEPLHTLVTAVRAALDTVPPEIAADIADRGMVLTGGGALLRGLDRRLHQETGVPVTVADRPLASVVIGAGRMLDDIGLLRRAAMAA